jgi:hypothetical protein
MSEEDYEEFCRDPVTYEVKLAQAGIEEDRRKDWDEKYQKWLNPASISEPYPLSSRAENEVVADDHTPERGHLSTLQWVQCLAFSPPGMTLWIVCLIGLVVHCFGLRIS